MADSEAKNQERTLFVSKVPKDWSKEQLMEWFDSIGFVDAYDFLYLPQDFQSRENLGYAFVNFDCEHHAREFTRTMADARIRLPGGLRLCVKQSKVQGRDANLAKWGTSRSRRIHNPETMLYVRRSPSPQREAGSSSAATAVASLHGDFEGASVDSGRGSHTQPSPAATHGDVADHREPQAPRSIRGALVGAQLMGQIPAEGRRGSLQAASAESWALLPAVRRAADSNVDRSSGEAPLEAMRPPPGLWRGGSDYRSPSAVGYSRCDWTAPSAVAQAASTSRAPEARVAPFCETQCQWQRAQGADNSPGGRKGANDHQGNWHIFKLDERQFASGDTRVSESSSHHFGEGVFGSESFESLGESSSNLRGFLPPGFCILDRLSV